MIFKLLGAAFVVTACGGIGYRIAANHRLEERSLRQLVGILDYIECELQYRFTSLPELCRCIAKEFKGIPGKIIGELTTEMESQISPDISRCMYAVLGRNPNILPLTKSMLEKFGASVGRFDINGQLKEIESLRRECRRNIDALENNRDARLRSYQTLGICAGAALAILLI